MTDSAVQYGPMKKDPFVYLALGKWQMSKNKRLEKQIRKTLGKAPGSSPIPPNFGATIADAMKDLPDETTIPVPMPASYMKKNLGKRGAPIIVKAMDGKMYRYKIAEIREIDPKNCEIVLKKEGFIKDGPQ